MQPETAEDFYARVEAATDADGRLAVAVEEMPGWDIFPFELDSPADEATAAAGRRRAGPRR